MHTVTEQTDDKQKQQEKENKLKASLTLHLDVERAFKLYSYRIINQDTYNVLVEDALEVYYTTVVKGQGVNNEQAKQREDL